MYVIYGYCEIFLPYASTLKEKRQTVQSILARLKKRVNISAMELKYHDLWQRTLLGFAAVAASQNDLDLIREVVLSTLDLHLADIEIINLQFDITPLQFDN